MNEKKRFTTSAPADQKWAYTFDCNTEEDAAISHVKEMDGDGAQDGNCTTVVVRDASGTSVLINVCRHVEITHSAERLTDDEREEFEMNWGKQ